MLDDEKAKDLLSFLNLGTRADLKGQATEYILGLTGSAEGCSYLNNRMDFLRALLTLTADPSVAVVKDCYHALINLSAGELSHDPLVKEIRIVRTLLPRLLDPQYGFADQICTILSNLTRSEKTCRDVFHTLQEEGVNLAQIVEIFCTEGYNKKASLHYLGPLLSNLTQLPETRHFLLDKNRCVIQRLLPYTQYEGSTIRRGGAVGTLRNCCFDYKYHEWLLSDAVDILPFLLLPLAGPEEFTEEEMEGMPVDLQYLPEDKKREKDPDIRKMLIEAVQLLTATSKGRRVVKEKRIYLIMREFHKWETEPDVLVSCEKLIQVLIGDEPETGMENLMEVKIPEEVEEKLRHLDEEEEKQVKREKEEAAVKTTPEGAGDEC
ncbi:protein HGH1 homolog [Latimeria chalumnae]|uniref:Protein HGH1 homolog n=1 Tax=Latimeria chalumnae TaxID=7897 RepID=H3B6K4_LATCH|nr:PREDICTED: protein HGH1 homolog [Latimeria chalumnae]XP_005996849.1 PREDICTED: protein HGH1 homolog [Latimeria chalumnae]XP_005996850.1 PREDICTED: protein HGH1 homolog [Latimeria chalumnae]XP_014344340.1 PREDICTED: protein HGH1 homolog [Latimeria chalumnae]|eukprot:XP_005996848.1 PREDICTED: protein HGH1 homolog [Latimeria chalumnae]